MKIRPYKIIDYNAVRNILIECNLFDDIWDSRNHLTEKIKRDPNSILLAEEDNEIVGCIFIISDPWVCFLYRLAVRESCRRKGIGSKLIEAAEDQLQSYNTDEVAIFVDANNDELQSYYQKRGYLKGGVYKCMYKKLKGNT